jgi:hypothetical protein
VGHLNRALAVCLELRSLGVAARIVSNSPFAAGLARAARFPITGVEPRRWREDVRAFVASAPPRLLVCDTFPRGIRGEWEAGLPAPAVYVARRLNAQAAAALFPVDGWRDGFLRIVVAEELAEGHQSALEASGLEAVRLPGPIRLRPGLIATPVPAELERRLDAGRCCLVVHGGPEEETARLVAEARGHGEPAVITPWGFQFAEARSFDYFPAGNLVARAAHAVSGAGYNAMADMMFQRDRHMAIPFLRRFDDQAGRLAAWRTPKRDGVQEAAQAIAALVR